MMAGWHTAVEWDRMGRLLRTGTKPKLFRVSPDGDAKRGLYTIDQTVSYQPLEWQVMTPDEADDLRRRHCVMDDDDDDEDVPVI